MSFDDDQEVKLEKEKTKAKIWMYILIIFVSVGGATWFIYSICLSFKALGEDLSKNTYYVLELTDDTKKEIVTILENENKSYCESMYKIEWNHRFPHGTNIEIYCKGTENIIINSSDSEVIKYINEFGITEKR